MRPRNARQGVASRWGAGASGPACKWDGSLSSRPDGADRPEAECPLAGRRQVPFAVPREGPAVDHRRHRGAPVVAETHPRTAGKRLVRHALDRGGQRIAAGGAAAVEAGAVPGRGTRPIDVRAATQGPADRGVAPVTAELHPQAIAAGARGAPGSAEPASPTRPGAVDGLPPPAVPKLKSHGAAAQARSEGAAYADPASDLHMSARPPRELR